MEIENILNEKIETIKEKDFELLKLKSVIFDIINLQEKLNNKFTELEKLKSKYVLQLKDLITNLE